MGTEVPPRVVQVLSLGFSGNVVFAADDKFIQSHTSVDQGTGPCRAGSSFSPVSTIVYLAASITLVIVISAYELPFSNRCLLSGAQRANPFQPKMRRLCPNGHEWKHSA